MSGPVSPVEEPDNSSNIQNPAAYNPTESTQQVQGVSSPSQKEDLAITALSTGALSSAKTSLMNVLNTVNEVASTSTVSSKTVDWGQQAQEALNTAETSYSNLQTTTDSSQVNVLWTQIENAHQQIQQAVQNDPSNSNVIQASEKMQALYPTAQSLFNNINLAQQSVTQINADLSKINASTSISEIENLLQDIKSAAATAKQAAINSNSQPLAEQASTQAQAASAQAVTITNGINTAYQANIDAQKLLNQAQETTDPGALENLLKQVQTEESKAQTAAALAPNSSLAKQAVQAVTQSVQQVQSLLGAVNALIQSAISSSASQGASGIQSSETSIGKRMGQLLSLGLSSEYTMMIRGLRLMISTFETSNPSLADISGVMKKVVHNSSVIRSDNSVKTELSALLSKMVAKINAKNLSAKDKASLTSVTLPALASISGSNTLSVVYLSSVFSEMTRFLSSLSSGTVKASDLLGLTEGIKTLNSLYPSLNESGKSLVDNTMSSVLNTSLVSKKSLNEAIIKNPSLASQQEILSLTSSVGGFVGVLTALEQLKVLTQGSNLTLASAQGKVSTVLNTMGKAPSPVYMANPMSSSESLVSKLSEEFVQNTKMADSKQKQKFLMNQNYIYYFISNVASMLPRA